MSDEDSKSEPFVMINDEKTAIKDLNEEQLYLVRQIQSCSTKIGSLRMELDQLQAAQAYFKNKLSLSIQKKQKQKIG